MSTEKIRIFLQSFNYPILDESCQKIMSTILEIEPKIQVKGPIPLPTRRRIYCVLRSPHVNKDSREQFEIRRYKRIIDIYSASTQVLGALAKIDFSPAISTEFKLTNSTGTESITQPSFKS